jgi:hypothetical protein
VALSQIVFISLGYYDEKYTALTAIALVFCYGLFCAFTDKWRRVRSSPEGSAQAPAALTASGGKG